MPAPYRLDLTADQRAELESVRDHAALPYLRERAAAILKIAAGQRAAQVARDGLLHARHPETICAWLQRYRTEGLAGLSIRPGRGRKPAFSPPARHGCGGAGGGIAPAAA
jgi:Winged helix-turn helix